jgi:hypothetical protein
MQEERLLHQQALRHQMLLVLFLVPQVVCRLVLMPFQPLLLQW